MSDFSISRPPGTSLGYEAEHAVVMSRGYDWTEVLEVLRVAQNRNIDWR